jgi:hypothetical protein
MIAFSFALALGVAALEVAALEVWSSAHRHWMEVAALAL